MTQICSKKHKNDR